jgi:large subunit ribosomal protein L21
MDSAIMDYAIIRVGNKQLRVRDGETLVVDHVHTDAGETFKPEVLLGDVAVTATVVSHERGPKIRIGKYRKRTGYKRHNGFRASSSRIQIALGGTAAGAKRASAAKETPAKETPAKAAKSKTEAPAKAEKVETAAVPAGVPAGYDVLTVAAITKQAKTWSHSELEAALAFEQEHGKRKGAITAIESALAKEGDS